MGYVVVENFALGVDQTRLQEAAPSGSLWRLVNAHISRGGDIERAKRFVQTYSLPNGTFGLAAVRGVLYTFGSADLTVEPPVIYQRLQHPSGQPMTRLLDAAAFDGKIHAVAEYADSSVHHFYDGVRVSDWDTIGVPLTDNAGVATRLAARINEDPDVTATATGAVVTVTGGNDNDDFPVLVSTVNGGANSDQSLTVNVTQAAGVSQPKIVTVTVGGTFETADVFTVTIRGRAYTATGTASGVGRTAKTFKQKLWSLTGSTARYSALNNSSRWDRGIGSGFINFQNESEGQEDLLVAEEYRGFFAFFARRSIRIWRIEVDDLLNVAITTVQNAGTVAGKSVLNFGNDDTMFLSDEGIRSLRPRDSSNFPTVSDLGVRIDTDVLAYMNALTDAQVAAAAAVIEPIDGRYLLALGNRVYVFSFFRSLRVSAWSYYELPFQITAWAVVGKQLFARAGNSIYLYGGADGNAYPADGEQVVTVETPYYDAGKPAHVKKWTGYDLVARNEWRVEMLVDPNRPEVTVDGGRAIGTTTVKPVHGAWFDSTHVAMRLTCERAGPASIAKLAFHNDDPHEAR